MSRSRAGLCREPKRVSSSSRENTSLNGTSLADLEGMKLSTRAGRLGTLVGLGALGLVTGCGSTGSKSGQGDTGALAVGELHSKLARVTADVSEASRAAASEKEFGVDLLAVQAGDSNLAFSPHSISTAFAMLTDAAAGDTLAQLADTFHFGTTDEAFQRSQDALDLELANRNRDAIDSSDLHVGPQILTQSNDVWIRNDAPPAPSYLDTLAEYYGAGVHQADFAGAPEQARLAIDAKVSDDTHGLIPELIPAGDLGADTVTVLTNAIYFKAPWQTPFSAPEPGDFHLRDGSLAQIDLLGGGGTWQYYDGDGFLSLAVPYYGGDLELMLIVPDAGTYDAFRAGFTSAVFDDILANRAPTLVAVTMPKFSVKSVVPAKSALVALGMPLPFTTEADFPKLVSPAFPEVYVSDVLHQATISVDENGTEASAATAIATVSVLITDPNPPEPLIVNIDRPFLFALRDNPTGAVLFLGQVVTP